jgi:hypothetical protein
MPEVVTAAMLARARGAVGTEAAKIVTSFEKVELNPKAFLDSTLNL